MEHTYVKHCALTCSYVLKVYIDSAAVELALQKLHRLLNYYFRTSCNFLWDLSAGWSL